jgi:hypothetical protein
MAAHPILLLLDNLSIGTIVVGGRVFDFVNNRRFHVLRLFQNQSATASGFLKKKNQNQRTVKNLKEPMRRAGKLPVVLYSVDLVFQIF